MHPSPPSNLFYFYQLPSTQQQTNASNRGVTMINNPVQRYFIEVDNQR